eukprot:6189589-Pleurochrysis_carterae.AAC.3
MATKWHSTIYTLLARDVEGGVRPAYHLIRRRFKQATLRRAVGSTFGCMRTCVLLLGPSLQFVRLHSTNIEHAHAGACSTAADACRPAPVSYAGKPDLVSHAPSISPDGSCDCAMYKAPDSTVLRLVFTDHRVNVVYLLLISVFAHWRARTIRRHQMRNDNVSPNA